MNQETAQNRRKVLLVITKSNLGGAQRYVLDLAKGLSTDRYEVVVAFGPAQGSRAPGALAELLRAAGIRTAFVPDLGRDVRVWSDLRAFRDLYALLRAERPDVVHLNSSKAGGIGSLVARLAGVPRIVFTSHGLAYDEPRNIFARGAIFVATWVTFVLSHVVICISNDSAARAARLPLCRSKVRRIYNGIRATELLDRTEARARILSLDPGAASGGAWIGTISELVPNKGTSYALKACEDLKRRGIDFTFFVIGDGDLRDALASAAAKRGLSQHVRFLGYVPNASQYLRAFDVFVLTSMKEGLPYVLLEAAEAGLPVVGTDIPGINDIIEDGVSGALCPVDDPEMCAHALSELLEDPALRERFGAKLKERAAATFSIDTMLSSTLEAYGV